MKDPSPDHAVIVAASASWFLLSETALEVARASLWLPIVAWKISHDPAIEPEPVLAPCGQMAPLQDRRVYLQPDGSVVEISASVAKRYKSASAWETAEADEKGGGDPQWNEAMRKAKAARIARESDAD
jgi:hypothetical protein